MKTRVRLDDIINAISTSSNDTEYYYDSETGDLEMTIDGELLGNRDIDLSDENRYIQLPDRFELDEMKMTENFAEHASDQKIREALIEAIRADDSLDRFRSTVQDLGVGAQWDLYRNEVFKQAATEWCDFNGIEYSEGEENPVVPGGIYEHFKGKRYKVIGVAKHSETLEELVVYRALYGDGGLWVRPRAMFCEKVTKRNGEVVDRFHLVDSGSEDPDAAE